MAVDLNAVLLKGGRVSPVAAVAGTVQADPTTKWYQADERGQFERVDSAPGDVELALLVRTPEARAPAWHQLLRDQLGIEDFVAFRGDSSGAILFVRTAADGANHRVAWCFGQGSHWLRREAVSPRFGLLVALNALADPSNSSAPSQVGVVGASVAAREGNLRRANLVAAVPAAASGIARVDTLADVLTGARVRTGHDLLGSVSGARSLQFPAVIGSVEQFKQLSGLVVRFALQDDYRRAHGWIDYTVPETDEQVVDVVLDCIWKGENAGHSVHVEIAWWEDVRESGSDHPATHWRLAGERKGKQSSRTVTVTWAGVKSQIERRVGESASGREALDTEIRFFGPDEEELGRCKAVELLSAELSLAGTTYLVVDGEVCRVDAAFLATLDDYLEQHRAASRLVAYRPGELEASYNGRAAAAMNMLLLDTKDIRPGGETQIEPCDLLGLDGALCHVKRHSTAAGISHLVGQATASATVLLRDTGARDKLCALIDAGGWDPEAKQVVREKVEGLATTASRLPVVLAVVGEWERPTVKSLSLLSRLTLRNGVQRLEDIGFTTELMLIDAHADDEPALTASTVR